MFHPISWMCIGKQANQFDNAIDLHFFQDSGAMLGHGLLADAELSGDLLRAFSSHQEVEHLVLACGESFDVSNQLGLAAGLAVLANVMVDGLPNADRQRLAADRLLQEIQRTGAHGLDCHRNVGAPGDHNDWHTFAVARRASVAGPGR